MCSKQTELTTVDSIKILSWKRRSVEILGLKYLKTRGVNQKKKKLEESSFQVVFASLISVKLAQIWQTSCLRIAWQIFHMHDRKLNGCRQRLLFARQLIPRKCSLCSQGIKKAPSVQEPLKIYITAYAVQALYAQNKGILNRTEMTKLLTSPLHSRF